MIKNKIKKESNIRDHNKPVMLVVAEIVPDGVRVGVTAKDIKKLRLKTIMRIFFCKI